MRCQERVVCSDYRHFLSEGLVGGLQMFDGAGQLGEHIFSEFVSIARLSMA